MCQFQSSCMRVGMVFELIIDLWLSCQAFLYLSLLPTMPPGPSQQASFWLNTHLSMKTSVMSYRISMFVEAFRTFAHFPKTMWDCWPRFFRRRGTLMRHFIKYPLAAPQWMRRTRSSSCCDRNLNVILMQGISRNQSQLWPSQYHPSWLRESPKQLRCEAWFFKIRSLTILTVSARCIFAWIVQLLHGSQILHRSMNVVTWLAKSPKGDCNPPVGVSNSDRWDEMCWETIIQHVLFCTLWKYTWCSWPKGRQEYHQFPLAGSTSKQFPFQGVASIMCCAMIC